MSVPTFLSFQPLLINVVNLSKKGCSVYSKFLKKKINLNTPLTERENKWHAELKCTYGTNFWNRTYNLAASIKHENKIKWLQYQINRNSLFTNYKVNKFKPHVSPNCAFCSHNEEFSHLELVSHLFWDCDFVLKLWQEVKIWLATLNYNLPLDRTKLMFGLHDQASSSVLNYVILCVKYFIWKTKFQSKDLSLPIFQKYLKSKLEDLKDAYIYIEKEKQFNQWNNVYVYLSRLPCNAINEAPLPTQSDIPAADPPAADLTRNT